MREPHTHHVTISAMDWYHLWHGDKAFVVLPEDTTPPLRYGDVLVMSHPQVQGVLVRWVRYLENGVHLPREAVAVELAP